ncbi:hypothetical protein [Halarcobacter sp.]|uniref:type II secretion system protein GspD n=1 Tax=Halarcobacter sp. TaxID=2321133 RepID=UPI002AAAB8A5|nr:hypothetical protein [Halarcobacter sp.]
MKRILLIILIFYKLLLSNDLDSIPLKEYISMISYDLNMTFVISDEIDENFTLMIPKELSNDDYLKILLTVLNKNNLIIEPMGTFFVISRKEDDTKTKLYSIQLKNIDFETIKPLFQTLKDIKYNYISSNKTIVFNSTYNQYEKILNVLKSIDKLPKQMKLKVSIIDTNLDKLKEYGTQLQLNKTLTENKNFFFNLLAYPFEVTSEVAQSNINQLHTFIKLMDTNNISKLISSPVLSLYDNKSTEFNLVKNIPYISGTTTTNDSNTTSITSYSYKDVGLKVTVLPKIYKDNVYLDLNIVSESIIDNSDEKPTVSKSNIKQTINISKNKIFVLSGLNQTQNYNTYYEVPILSKIPYLGWAFKMESTNKINSSLTIFLELIDNENLSILDNKINIDLPKEISKKSLIDNQNRINKLLGIN